MRFHTFCRKHHITANQRLPRNAMKQFVEEHIKVRSQEAQLHARKLRHWYAAWQSWASNIVAVEQDTQTQAGSQACYLKSRRHVPEHARKRGQGGGRPFKAAIVRQQLYEWWAGLRYAIDWQALIENRRSRGKKI